jgi:hypothetical protein
MQGFHNNLDHRIGIRENRMIPETQDLTFPEFEKIGTRPVRFLLFAVLAAVSLDNEAGLTRYKVHDARPDRNWAAEFDLLHAAIAKT